MIFNKPSLLTKLNIWAPKYSAKYTDIKERVALLAVYKVDHASPWILVEFTKAKHLLGQRYCVKRSEVQACRVESNGSIPCYAVPMSKLEDWITVSEVEENINSFGW